MAPMMLRTWRPGMLARNTAYAGTWNLLRIALQALNLIALARLFGAEGYGVLAGTIALFSTCGQFVGLGTGIALVRDGARDPAIRDAAYRRTRVVYLVTGLAIFVLAWPLGTWLLGHQLSTTAIGAIAFAEIVAAPAIMPLVYRMQSEERMAAFGALLSFPTAIRLVVTAMLLFLAWDSITEFALLYLAAMLGTALVVNIATRPPSSQKMRWSDLQYLKQGLTYMLPNVANTAGNELDKTILLRSAGAIDTGHYSAAYRIMQAAVTPVGSLMMAAAPRLFRSSVADGRATDKGLYVLCAVGYALPAGAILWILAPLLPWVLGTGFESSVPLLRALCAVLLIVALRQVILALLTASDLQRQRNSIEIFATLGSIFAMLVAIPALSSWGAILVLGSTDLIVVISGSFVLRRSHKK